MKQISEYPDVLTVKDTQAILGISRATAYDLARSGKFHTIKIGALIKIPKSTFIDWLNGTKN